MTTTGIRRKVDDLGRIVIPAGMRRALGIREGDALDVTVDGEAVVLSKPIDRCAFCGSQDALQTFRGKMVCRSCVASIGVLDESLRARPVPAAPDAGEGLPAWPVGGPRPRPRADRQVVAPAADLSGQPSEGGYEPPTSTTAW